MGKYSGPTWIRILSLAGLFLGLQAKDSFSYSGFIGCQFSKVVCQKYEVCIDDRLFGTCQNELKRKDQYKYYLDIETLKILETEIQRLVDKGYTWENLYTQCVIGNILLAFRSGVEVDRLYCDRDESPPQDNTIETELSLETLKLLEKYFQDYYNDMSTSSQLDDSGEDVVGGDYSTEESQSVEKKDEPIRIHKYFSQEKRDDLDIAELVANAKMGGEDSSYGNYNFDDIIENLSQEDLAILQEYLNKLEVEDELMRSMEAEGGNLESQEFLPQLTPQGYEWDSRDFEAAMPGPEDSPELYGKLPELEDLQESKSIEGTKKEPSYMSMSPADAKTLGDLLQEKIDVASLSNDQVDRLSKYVDGILKSIGQVEDTEESQEGVEENDIKFATEEGMNEGIGKDKKDPRYMYAIAVDKKESDNNVVVNQDEDAENSPAAIEKEVEGVPKDHHDHHFEDSMVNTHTNGPKYDVVDANYAYLKVKPDVRDFNDAYLLLNTLADLMGLPGESLGDVIITHGMISFLVNPNPIGANASTVAHQALAHVDELKNRTGLTVVSSGIGRDTKISVAVQQSGPKFFVLTFVLCGVIAGLVLFGVTLYVIRQHHRSREKLQSLSAGADGTEAEKDYQDLCRQRMQSKSSEKPEPINVASRVGSVSTSEQAVRSPSSRSSTSSWSEEPVTSNMDISTGHIVLSYMEDHLKNKDRLHQEWDALVAYEAEPNSTATGESEDNMRKNRYSDVLPYDHSRVVLSKTCNVTGSDYINASTITDHDPRNPAYITTQGPLPHTVADFWQMVWEQGSVVIVNLTKMTESGVAMAHRYWPEEGSDLYHIYEVHLVSEHIWCDDYLVRSFYLKNLQTNETRTVTQFHFLTWPDLGVPSSAKALLDFRRKVNKSYRGRSCPIVVHCSDGVGRSGVYCLIDMVLNRMSKGAKEIDIAATLEHIRDQRMGMVKTKEQFEFALSAVAEEVHAILKALPQ